MGAPKIDSYSFGEIIIDGVKYKSDVVVSPVGVFPNWWRLEGHKLQLEDLKDYLSKVVIDVLIAGTGASGLMKVSDEVRREMRARGIELIALPTDDACKLYNELREHKRVMGVFHLTC
ncbi:MAG: Mth938-like domain-containing protein [Synergistetes bacterium]|nr:Mth938-like domain-containing protein [Synergistota bacterium]